MERSRNNEDIESEISSKASSNFNLIKQKGTFSIEEPTTNSEIWYQWLKNRIKHYMVLEGVFLILLVLIFINSYKTSAKDDKILELIANIESRMTSLEKRMELLGNVQMNPIQNREFRVEPEVLKEQQVVPQTIKYTLENSRKAASSSLSLFNAANFLIGASVDSSKSSDSNLSPFLTWDQTGLVILDRPEPPVHKAWCSSEKNPVLTVNLVKYVKPVAVSYQHSKWESVIPNGAPKRYSVSACLDYNCEDVQLMVSNCKYIETTNDQQEQRCLIPPNKNLTSIVKVQFQFHENHGNTEETCVNLVRVYGEAEIVPKIAERKVEDAEHCSVLKNRFYHNSIAYTFGEKNCTVLYYKQCCQECPECCAECEIEDFNYTTILNGILYASITVTFTLLALIVLVFILAGCLKCCGIDLLEDSR